MGGQDKDVIVVLMVNMEHFVKCHAVLAVMMECVIQQMDHVHVRMDGMEISVT